MFYMVITQKDVDTLFGFEKINEGVSLLGKCVCRCCFQGPGPFEKTVPLELNR